MNPETKTRISISKREDRIAHQVIDYKNNCLEHRLRIGLLESIGWVGLNHRCSSRSQLLVSAISASLVFILKETISTLASPYAKKERMLRLSALVGISSESQFSFMKIPRIKASTK